MKLLKISYGKQDQFCRKYLKLINRNSFVTVRPAHIHFPCPSSSTKSLVNILIFKLSNNLIDSLKLKFSASLGKISFSFYDIYNKNKIIKYYIRYKKPPHSLYKIFFNAIISIVKYRILFNRNHIYINLKLNDIGRDENIVKFAFYSK